MFRPPPPDVEPDKPIPPGMGPLGRGMGYTPTERETHWRKMVGGLALLILFFYLFSWLL